MASTLADAQRDLAATGGGPVAELKPGTMSRLPNTSTWVVTVGTNTLPVIWGEHITPRNDAPCLVAMMTYPTGLTTAWVVAMTQETAPKGPIGKVLVVPGGSSTITVDVYGTSITATIVTPYAPAVNDNVLLDQQGGITYAVGKVGAAAAAPGTSTSAPAPAAPPPVAQTGKSDFRAQDSGTWTNGYNWNSHFGQNAFSGSGYVPPSTGHWFYSNATTGLSDKGTITNLGFWLGPRKASGNHRAAATVHFYRHSAVGKGGSEPARTHGPHDVSIPAGWGGGWINLPASFGEALKGGGGISIAGDPYVGFASGAESPASGTLSADWSK